MNEWQVIAEVLKRLTDRVKLLERRLDDRDQVDEADLGEPLLASTPRNPATGSSLLQLVTIVCSSFPSTKSIYVQRALPTTSTATPWAVDGSHAGLLKVNVPDGVAVPEVGSTQLITFTGVTSNGATHGLFGGGGGASQFRVKAVYADMVKCRTLDQSLNEGTNDIYVAKPYKIRQSPFDGQTLYGLSFSYTSSPTVRTVTNTLGSTLTQYVIPAFRDDLDIIYGISTTTNVPNSLGGYCTYVDMNNDHRGWASQ